MSADLALQHGRAGLIPPRLWWGFAAVAAAGAAIVAAPLAAYVLLLALFGLPHVIYELRYCDERFAGRLPRRTLALIGGLLAGVAAVRLGQAAGIVGAWSVALELGLGSAMALTAISLMQRRRIVGAAAAVAVMTGAVFAPLESLLVLAWLHNLTPLAFAAEITPPGDRWRTVGLLAIPFLGVPAIVATGAPAALLHALAGGGPAGLSLFGAGTGPLRSYLPAGAGLDGAAASLFAGAVTAQAMHYFGVIVVLPAMLQRAQGRRPDGALAPWPSWSMFGLAVAAASLGAFALYAANYSLARNLYGVAAALHVWIELPLLLFALGQVRGPESARPGPMRDRLPAPTG